MTTSAYFRCNEGHLFRGSACPLDGWTSTDVASLENALIKISEQGIPISLQALQSHGLTEEAAKRTIVLESGSDAFEFDALSPDGYVIEGKWKKLSDTDQAFH